MSIINQLLVLYNCGSSFNLNHRNFTDTRIFELPTSNDNIHPRMQNKINTERNRDRRLSLFAIIKDQCAALANVILQLSTLLKRIIWTIWSDTKFNSDVILNTPEMIREAGYPVEAHIIMTEDGYLLTLHRIPGGNDSLPVLLLHGLTFSSSKWLIPGKGRAFPYLLADQGYDVWLGNFRGTTYSKAHISLSPSSLTFWDFSLDEMGIYDLSAMITFITNMRAQPLHTCVGHSMGTTCFYIMASERPEIARMVKMLINFGPTVFLNDMQSPLRFLVPFRKIIRIVMQLFCHGELFCQSDFVRFLLKNICDQNIARQVGYNIMSMIWGDDHEQFDHTLQSIIISDFLDGTSVRAGEHYIQGVQSGKFRKYDYGRAKNLLIYNSAEPPDYNLANITVPSAIFYGLGDLIVNVADVKRLYHILPKVVDMYEVPWPKFNHLDFIWAKDAPKLVYERAFMLMKNKNLGNVK